LHDEGKSNREIARMLNINKETVNNYVKTLNEHPSEMEKLLELDDPELERKLHEGNPAYTDERFNEFSSLLPYLQKELGRKHVTRRLLWQEYIEKYPEGYRFTQFCFHLKQNLVASSPTTVLSGTYNPAEKLRKLRNLKHHIYIQFYIRYGTNQDINPFFLYDIPLVLLKPLHNSF